MYSKIKTCALIIIAASIVVVPNALHAQTYISGTIPSSTWTKAASPYVIHGTVTVDSNLIIEPGVVVEFTYDNGLQANLISAHGFIHAVGTEEDSIRFTKDKYDQGTGWQIQFAHGEPLMDMSNVFKYCVFENGTTALHAMPSPEGRADTLMHCAIRRHDYGIYAGLQGARLFLSDCVISGCERGITDANISSPADLWVQRTEIKDCWRGVAIEAPGVVRMRNCTVADIGTVGLTLGSSGSDLGARTDIEIADDPLYCNSFINCETGFLNYTRRTARARYNYWGTEDAAAVDAQVWSMHPSYIAYLPFMDANCQPIPLNIQNPPVPAVFALEVFPNPVAVGQEVMLTYTLPFAASGEMAYITLTDILGREVRRMPLIAEPGAQKASMSTAGLRGGVYFCRIGTGLRAAASKMVLVQ